MKESKGTNPEDGNCNICRNVCKPTFYATYSRNPKSLQTRIKVRAVSGPRPLPIHGSPIHLMGGRVLACKVKPPKA
jgi:hypothetical protein